MSWSPILQQDWGGLDESSLATHALSDRIAKHKSLPFEKNNAMQKVVSVYLDVAGYSSERSGLRFSNADLHGKVEELLDDYTNQGWKVAQLTSLPGGATGGWIVAVLEK